MERGKDGAIDTVVETVVTLNADEIKTCRVRALCAADEVLFKAITVGLKAPLPEWGVQVFGDGRD